MTYRIFGWSYPPGCNSVPGDEPDPPCEICGNDWDNCICPVCPVCRDVGLPECYIEHGLRRTEEQQFSLVCNERQWALKAFEQARAEAKLWEEIERMGRCIGK